MPHTEMMEERLRFLQIDQDVIEELRAAKQFLEPEIGRILERFYSHILDEPQVKAIFADDESIERARQAQKNYWLNTLFGGKFDSAYVDQAQLIGRAHARIGLTLNWYIGGYSNLLVQVIQRISLLAPKWGRNPRPIIEAACKVVLLDLDVVIHCYLEAKDRVMLDLLMRATLVIDELAEMSSELSLATAQIRVSTETLLEDTKESERQTGIPGELLVHTGALADKVKQMDERIGELKVSDRLYLKSGIEHTETFAKLRAQLIGE
ncbi:MAG: protoglobin domain-containing protein [Woeseiaceae bacterium]